MKTLFIICIIFILAGNVFAYNNITLRITEFFPNPIGKDNFGLENMEFIEIYNFGASEIYLDGFKIYNNKNKSLSISEYFKSIKPDQYIAFYPAMKFSLKNNGKENLILTYKDFLIDEVGYLHSKEGFSWAYISNNWTLTKPTPGRSNTNENLKDPKLNINHITNKSEKLLNITNFNTSRAVYKSKTLKQGKIGLYLFLFTLTLIIISFAVEKWKINKLRQE